MPRCTASEGKEAEPEPREHHHHRPPKVVTGSNAAWPGQEGRVTAGEPEPRTVSRLCSVLLPSPRLTVAD